MLKDLVKSWVRPFGVDLVRYPPLTPLARQLRSFLCSNEVNLVLDIGACDGGYCRFLRGPVGYKGRIVSFEPTKKTFEMLKSKMSSDRLWSGYNVGVSERDGEGKLYTYGDNYDFNSVLELREKDAGRYHIDLDKKDLEKICLRSIDSLWDEITKDLATPRVYLKTDTQGHDPAVIRGAQPRLECVVGLQSEIPAVQIYDGMSSMSDTLGFLSTLGYTPIGFHPINQPSAYNGMAPEFDVVFVRNSASRYVC